MISLCCVDPSVDIVLNVPFNGIVGIVRGAPSLTRQGIGNAVLFASDMVDLEGEQFDVG